MMLPAWDSRLLSLSKLQSLRSNRLTHETLAEAEIGSFMKLPQLYMFPYFPCFPFFNTVYYIVLHCWRIARKFYDVAIALRKISALQCKLLDNLGSRKAKSEGVQQLF